MIYECETCEHYRHDREVCQLNPEPVDPPVAGGCGQHSERQAAVFKEQTEEAVAELADSIGELLKEIL